MYRTKDGTQLKGSDPVEVITSLRDQSWMGNVDLQSYVEKTAHFAELRTGTPVRRDTAENLLADLMSVGLIVREN